MDHIVELEKDSAMWPFCVAKESCTMKNDENQNRNRLYQEKFKAFQKKRGATTGKTWNFRQKIPAKTRKRSQICAKNTKNVLANTKVTIYNKFKSYRKILSSFTILQENRTMTEQNFYLKQDELVTAHYGEEYEHYYNAIVPPVFMNSLNVFETLDDYYDYDRRDKHKYCYGRVQNPTVRILEDKLAALERGVGALAFASGMAAASTAVLSVIKTGSHVVCVRNAYGPLAGFLSGYCKEHMNVETTFVAGDRIEDFAESVTDQTDLIVLESPSSVIFSLQDIRAVSKIAKEHGAKIYIDNSYCTPFYQKPLELGADIVMHTSSKYIGGHSDLIGGVLVAKDEELFRKLTANRELLGGIPGPMEAWLMIRGLRTMKVRIDEHQKTAQAVAEFLENHPKVRRVNYPGLLSHPQYELMKTQQTGSTGLLSFEIDGSVRDAAKLAEHLKIFKIGVSWGGFESLVFLPCMRMTEEEARVKEGCSNNIIRIHCGLEGTEALISDLEQAFAQI